MVMDCQLFTVLLISAPVRIMSVTLKPKREPENDPPNLMLSKLRFSCIVELTRLMV